MINTSANYSDKLSTPSSFKRWESQNTATEKYVRLNKKQSNFDWTSLNHSIFLRKIDSYSRYAPPKNKVKGDGAWNGDIPESQLIILPKDSRVYGVVDGSCTQQYTSILFEHEKLFSGLKDQIDISKVVLKASYVNQDCLLSSLILQLSHSIEECKSPIAKIHRDSLIILTGVHLAKYYSNITQINTVPKGGLSSFNLRLVKEFIEENLEHLPDLNMISALTNLSHYHFLHSFKKSTGMTLTAYVNSRRIFRSCELLAQTHQTITEIAFTVGYSSPSRMNENFKNILGITPRQYRSSL